MKLKTFYLSGPIEFPKDGGRTWRKRAKRALKNIGCVGVDPTDKESTNFVRENRQMRKDGKFDAFHRTAVRMMERDLRLVKECDAVLVHLPNLAHAFGTIVEMYEAYTMRKPVFIIHNKKAHETNAWLVETVLQGAYLPEERMFRDLKSFVRYVKKNGA